MLNGVRPKKASATPATPATPTTTRIERSLLKGDNPQCLGLIKGFFATNVVTVPLLSPLAGG